MIESPRAASKLDILYLRTYGPRRVPVLKEYMNRDEVIAMSPLGSTQNTEISKKFASHREALPLSLKKALNYLYPARNSKERPPKTKYDSMVRKMSNFSLQQNYENSSKRILLSPLANDSTKKGKKIPKQPTLMRKLSGLFDFPKKDSEKPKRILKKRSKSVIKLPVLHKIPEHQRYSSVDYINCINYTGEAESEYLKSKEAQTEYRKLYELMLVDSGLYTEIRIRNQNKNRVHYKRMPA